MNPSGELVVHSAASHFFQSSFGHGQQVLASIGAGRRRTLILLQNQIQRGAVWKFGSFAKTTIANIEELGKRTELRLDDRGVERSVRAGEGFCLLDRIGERTCRAFQIRPPALE